MRTTWTFHSAGRIVFGVDAIASLGDHLQELGAETDRVLVVTDEMLVEAGVCGQVTDVLDAAGIGSPTTTELAKTFCSQPRTPAGNRGDGDGAVFAGLQIFDENAFTHDDRV